MLFSCITPYWLELPLPQEVPEQVGLYKNKVRRRLQLLKCYCDSTKFCLICCFASVTFAPFLNQIPNFKEDHNSNWKNVEKIIVIPKCVYLKRDRRRFHWKLLSFFFNLLIKLRSLLQIKVSTWPAQASLSLKKIWSVQRVRGINPHI